MNESPAPSAPRPTLTFSERYRRPILCALAFAVGLFVLSVLALDGGQCLRILGYSLGVYLVLLLLIMLRRPATPSRLDLALVGVGLPLLFITLFLACPLAWHLRGLL